MPDPSTDCIFCKIAAGTIPAKIAFQNDELVAFYDTNPAAPVRMMLTAIKQAEVDTRTTLSEDQIYALLMTEAKKRRDSITEMRGAGRNDLADKEQAELVLIESYLPQQLTREEVEAEARKAIT